MRSNARSRSRTASPSARRPCPRTGASRSGSASTSATSSSRTATSWATASTSPRASRAWPSPAASASPATSTTRSRPSSTSPSSRWASTGSRTSPSRSTVYRVNLDAPGRARRRRPVWAQRRWQAAAAAVVCSWRWRGGAWYALRPLRCGGGRGSCGLAAADKPRCRCRTSPRSRCCRSTTSSGDEATERLADGITEDIITDLSRFRELVVIARNSTEVYKGKPVDVRQVGKDLNVGYVLEGSIQRQGDSVRVTGAADRRHDRHPRLVGALGPPVDGCLRGADRGGEKVAAGVGRRSDDGPDRRRRRSSAPSACGRTT